jgi:hypothetical protein
MIVYVGDAHAHVQRLVSVVKMAIVLEECNTEEQRSVAVFLGGKMTQCEGFTKKYVYIMFTVGSVCLVKWFTTG